MHDSRPSIGAGAGLRDCKREGAGTSDPAKMAEEMAWTLGYFADVVHAGTGVYVNFLHEEGEARIRQAYPEATYRRLAQIKARWDPENVLHRNQNIRPA